MVSGGKKIPTNDKKENKELIPMQSFYNPENLVHDYLSQIIMNKLFAFFGSFSDN